MDDPLLVLQHHLCTWTRGKRRLLLLWIDASPSVVRADLAFLPTFILLEQGAGGGRDGGAEEEHKSNGLGGSRHPPPPPPMTPAIKDLLPKVSPVSGGGLGGGLIGFGRLDAIPAPPTQQVLHVNQTLLQEVVAMRPPSPGTYTTFADSTPSHISVLLLAARALYSPPAFQQRLFPKHSALPFVACLAGGLHSPECLHALMALRAATAGRPHRLLPPSSSSRFGGAMALTEAEALTNRKHAFDAGLVRALAELVEAAVQLVLAHPPQGAPSRRSSAAGGVAGQEKEAPSSEETVQADGQEAEGATTTTEGPVQGMETDEEAAQAESTRQQGEEPATAFPLPLASDPLTVAVPTLRVLLDLLCAFLQHRGAPPTEHEALRRLLLQHSVLLFELSRHPVRAGSPISPPFTHTHTRKDAQDVSPLTTPFICDRTFSCGTAPPSWPRRSSSTRTPCAPWPSSTPPSATGCCCGRSGIHA